MKSVATWTLSGVLALVYIFSGVTKLLGTAMQTTNIESWAYPTWIRFPIGLGEIALAIGLLTEKYRVLTIYGIYVWMAIAVITHLRVGQYYMIAAPVTVALVASILLWVIRRPVDNVHRFAGEPG